MARGIGGEREPIGGLSVSNRGEGGGLKIWKKVYIRN